MAGWKQHTGSVVSLPLDNVDTDQIIPARFMSQPRVDGYGDFLFHDLRRDKTGSLDGTFPLNQCAKASILLTGDNFGCGSSREAAAYALLDAGFKVLLGTGFGDIFSANAVNNGLLPATLSAEDVSSLAALVKSAEQQQRPLECTVDLSNCLVYCAGHSLTFTIDPSSQTRIMNGWDDIDLTLEYASRINRYLVNRKQNQTWAWPEKHADGKAQLDQTDTRNTNPQTISPPANDHKNGA